MTQSRFHSMVWSFPRSLQRTLGVSLWVALAGGVGLWPTVAVSAQVTYTIIPAFPQTAVVSQQPTERLTTRVTLAVRDSTLSYIVNELARQAHLRSAIKDSPALDKRKSVHIAGMDVMDAFSLVLRGTGLTARLAPGGETVVIRAQDGVAGEHSRLASGTVAGRVTDSASGAGLGGASVRVEGVKSLSAVTSDSGHFTLKDVPPGDQVLTVKLFGYKAAQRTVTVVDSRRTTVRIVMESVPTVLSGVVTTATGLQQKVKVGNDITTLNVDSIRQFAPITSVTDLLETRVPGLTVLHSSGTPGDPSRLRLRGAGSIQGNNDPIIVIDGIRVYASQSNTRNNNLAPGAGLSGQAQVVADNSKGFTAPSPLDQIDPASIETIEVLKGPSATAIYGSDAASGVIVITTEHGRAGPTRWTLDLGQGVNWSPGRWPANYFRFGYDSTGVTGAVGLCQWYIPSCHIDSVVAYQALNDPRFTVFSHGSDQTADLSVSGGVPTLIYSVGGSGAGDVGLLKLPAAEQERYNSFYGATLGLIPHALVRPDHYTHWGVNGTLTALPSPAIRVTLTSSLFSSTQQQGSLSSAIPQLEGNYIGQDYFINNSSYGNGFETGFNDLIKGYVEQATDEQVTQTNALSLHWQPISWLPLDATGGFNTIQRTDHTYIPFGVSASQPGAIGETDTTGWYGVGRGVSHEQTLNVGTAIPLRLMTLALGGNVVTEATADVSAQTNQLAPGISTPTSFPCPPATSNCVNVTQATAGASTYGWYFEPRLNFASRFFVAPGFRLDGGSGGTRAGYSGGALQGLSAFPKMDFSWVAVDRSGGHPLWGVLTLLRPRVALGLAGTQPFPQQKLRLYNVGPATLGSPYVPQGSPVGSILDCQPLVLLNDSTQVPAVCLIALGNTQLRPERTRELEEGVDATLWQGRLSLTYTQYTKRTQDAILDIPVAPSATAISSMFTNIGVIRNTGTELTANAIVLQSRALSWNVGANLSNTNSLVVRLNPGQAPLCYGGAVAINHNTCNGTRIVAGYPLFGEWASPIAAFADLNHDGIIEPREIQYGDTAVYVGQPNPKFQLNLNTGLTLLNGRLSASATFAYMNGLTQDNQGACNSAGFALLPNAPTTTLATQAAVIAAACGSDLIGINRVTSIGLFQTVNTLRFNALSVNYEVPRKVASWFRVPRMSLALQGSNLGLHTNYRGKDPDVNAFATVSAGDETADLGQIPEPRTWWLKLTLGN